LRDAPGPKIDDHSPLKNMGATLAEPGKKGTQLALGQSRCGRFVRGTSV
jgi:hypothetical protein